MKRVITVLILLLLLSAFITNPTTDHFEEYASSRIDAELQGLTGDGFFSWALGQTVRTCIRTVAYRRDYKLFSIYYVELPVINYELRYLGVFGNFYLLNGIREEDVPEEHPDKETEENDVMVL